MGIIKRGRANGSSQHAESTLIAAGSKFVGDLALSDNLHVDGRIEGTICSEAEVAIGQTGSIEGELQARHVVICGGFEGNISAKRLEIVAGGRVTGDLTVAELVIEPGARFNGNSRIIREDDLHGGEAPGQPADRDDQPPAAAGKRSDKERDGKVRAGTG